MMTSILAFLVAVGLLVFVHEMGHYLAARSVGVHVLRFSVGFGRPLLRRVDRRGCEWVVAMIPLGGYVRMYDRSEPEVDAMAVDAALVPQSASFDQKSLGARAWVVVAGPLANFVFAAFAYALIGMIGRSEPVPVVHSPPVESAAAAVGLQGGDRILQANGAEVRSFSDLRWQLARASIGQGRPVLELEVQTGQAPVRRLVFDLSAVAQSVQTDSPDVLLSAAGLLPESLAVRLTAVQPGSAADRAGLMPSMLVLAVDGVEVRHPGDLQALVQASDGSPLTLETALADPTDPLATMVGSQRTIRLTADRGEQGRLRLGVGIAPVQTMTLVREGPIEALVRGTVRSFQVAELSLQALGRMVTGDLSWKQISGPVGIAGVAGQSAELGLVAFIGFLALVSISIGVLNLLPIPMLDGGHLLYYL
ncbi:MAG TPA: RIP metalloprotease RseP, partial [Burkholderiaceae bacterium]|nr:RIP metalloprotease RseP [Burkholderiaceae bacterium]